MPTRYHALALAMVYGRRRRKRLPRRWWVHPINAKRPWYGEYHHLMPDLRRHEQRFYRYFRMKYAEFDLLMVMLAEHLQKTTTNWRRPIGAEERLVITLRFVYFLL
jgi:hypothetical protein